MRAKTPWLPAHVPPGVTPHRCAACGKLTLIPWTLRRDITTKVVMRTWVCTACQQTSDKPEPE